MWVHSTQKQRLDERARRDALARALAALDRLKLRLEGPKCRFRERAEVERAAASALRNAGVGALVRFEIAERIERWQRNQSDGPGRKPRMRKREKRRFSLSWEVDQQALAREATTHGCFPLISNDRALTDAELLAAYRYQPNLEKRHHQLKSVLEATPVSLKSPARIEALLSCQFIALLICALIERELRRAMGRERIQRLPLYPEQRACQAPTAARTFELFAGLARHRLLQDGQLEQLFQPQLSDLQQQLLKLLAIPPDAYRNAGDDHPTN